MKTLKDIINNLEQKAGLVHIERICQLPFGSIAKMRETGLAKPEDIALLQMVDNFPWLLRVLDNFKTFTEGNKMSPIHPLLKECSELREAIDECGVSLELTKAFRMVENLHENLKRFIAETQGDTNELRYTVSTEKYDAGLNAISRAVNPNVEFREDLDAMRIEATEVSKKNIHEAYDIFTGLISNRE